MADNVVDKEIVDLPEATGVTGDTLFPGYVPGALNPAQKITAEQLKEYFGQEVFVAEYDVTTLTEIEDAISEGKLLFCFSSNYYAPLTRITRTGYVFSTVINLTVYQFTIHTTTGAWTSQSYLAQGLDNMVNVINSSGTDTQYPSAKAVYEFGKTLTIEGGGGSGLPGSDGEDGGYYIPNVSQPDQYTMQVDFTASKDDMAQVPTSYINLPPGPQGTPGLPGQPGSPGSPGKDGQDGYTPVKGTDYWTEEDRAAIVSDVLNALPAAEEASF